MSELRELRRHLSRATRAEDTLHGPASRHAHLQALEDYRAAVQEICRVAEDLLQDIAHLPTEDDDW